MNEFLLFLSLDIIKKKQYTQFCQNLQQKIFILTELSQDSA